MEAALATLLDVGAIEPSPSGPSPSGGPSGGPAGTVWVRSDPMSLLKALREKNSGGVRGVVNDTSLELTPLGRHIAKLPVDVKLGKMLVLGAVLGCLDPIATAVAALSSKSPFTAVLAKDRQAEVDAARRPLRAAQSDFLTAVNAFNGFEEAELLGGHLAARRFCEKHFLSHTALVEIRDQRRSFVDQLTAAGLIDRHDGHGDHRDRGDGSGGGGEGEDRCEGDADGRDDTERGITQDVRVQDVRAQGVGAGQPTAKAAVEGRRLAGGAGPSNRHVGNRNLVASVLCAGLYPHLCVSTGQAGGNSAAPLEWHCGKRGSVGRQGVAAGGEYTDGVEAEAVHIAKDSVNFGAKTMTTR